jgi:hypothetical protein
MRAPGKINEREVQELIDKALDHLLYDGMEEANRAARNRPDEDLSAVIHATIEAEAIADGRAGNFKYLAKLIDEGFQLGPEARKLIAQRLRGEFKSRRGRPKKAIGQRSSVVMVTEYLPEVERLLRTHYPDAKAYKDWAITCSARYWGIEENKLRNHLKSRHRVRYVVREIKKAGGVIRKIEPVDAPSKHRTLRPSMGQLHPQTSNLPS